MAQLVINQNELLKTTKAIYLMRAFDYVTNPNVDEIDLVENNAVNNILRFGVIGIRQGSNVAAARITQATSGWRAENRWNFNANNLRGWPR